MNDEKKFAELQSKLTSAGCSVSISQNIGKNFMFPREYDYIIYEYLGKFCSGHLNTHILHIITRNKDYDLIPVLLSQFEETTFEDYRWAIGDSLYRIGYCDTYYNDYVSIVENCKYRESRQMVILLLGKSKQEKACGILLSLLNKDNIEVLLHTVSALKFFKRIEKISIAKSFCEWISSNEGEQYFVEKMYERYSYLPYYSIKDAQIAYKKVMGEINKLLL